MTSAIVLGAGMIGVSTALHLQRRNVSVALVDRRGPGEETSFGNAGIIQSEAVEPYSMPRDVPSLARIALGRTNDVRYRLAALPSHAVALAHYWKNSAPHRFALICKAYGALIAYAVPEHDVLIREASVDNLVRHDGYLLIHRHRDQFEQAIEYARRLSQQWGVPYRLLDANGVKACEPSIAGPVAGAIHWTGPWSVSDPGRLVKAYAELFARGGGSILVGDARSLLRVGRSWQVTTDAGPIEAEHVVVALGPWSPELLKPFGFDFRIVRMRGYHRHFAGGAPLSHPLFDTENGYVLAPMARGLRLTTGAELTGRNAPATPVQLERAERAARQLIDLGSSVDPDPWFGTRPFLADMLPVIGEALPEYPGLWFNFGHGHQGFTLGPASGRLLAEMLAGSTPVIDPTPFRPHRETMRH
jgi:D-amino-acid dehydrogenase